MLKLLTCWLAFSLTAFAGSDRLVVDDDAYVAACTAKAAELQKAGKLVGLKKLRTGLARTECEIALPAPRTQKLAGPEVYRLVRESTVTVATFFKCAHCRNWHFEASSGFVAADGVVSTCHHVVDFQDERVSEGYLVVSDALGRVWPVAEVLAANPVADTLLLKVDGCPLPALPLRPDPEVGERLYCLGHPDGNHWMFTEGMLSRFQFNRDAPIEKLQKQKGGPGRLPLYLNITAEYSPGSSGAPVVDECGNVLGQVQAITASFEEEKTKKGGVVESSYGMPLRACSAAEEVLRMIKRPAPTPAQ
jgi:S1-C subfamily serine protease